LRTNLTRIADYAAAHMQLAGKSIVITDASAGIGRLVAPALVDRFVADAVRRFYREQ
jgi:hypothetical protein